MSHLTFDISKYSGYRLKVEQSNLSYYKKLKYNGFKIIVSSPYHIKYELDNQLIRRLKLLNLSDNIRKNSREDNLLELLEKSQISDNEAILPYSLSWASGSYSYYEDSASAYNKYQFKEKQKHHSNSYNQKIKQYGSKNRFR